MTAPLPLVAEREIRQRLRSRTYLVSTVLIAVAIVGIGVVSRIQSDQDDTRQATVAVVGVAPTGLAEAAGAAGEAIDLALTFVDEPDRAAALAAMQAGEVDAVVVGPDRALLFDGAVDDAVQRVVTSGWQLASAAQTAAAAGLTQQQIDQVLSPPPLEVGTVDPDDDRDVGALVGVAAGVLLFFALSLFGGAVLGGVVEEKTSAIIELLLARVTATQLLGGKVVGIGVVALTQLAVAMVAGVVALRISGASVPGEVWVAVPSALLWFLGGFALYSLFFALAGSFVSRPEDAQSAAAPISLVMLAAYLVVFAFAGTPDSTAATVLSLLPPFAPLIMPLRMATGSATFWQVALAAALLAGAVLVVLRFAAGIYAQTLLHRGSRISWREAVRMRSIA